NHLLEQLEAFLVELDVECDEACDVCVRAGKIGDKAGIDDVPNASEHDWNRCSCAFGREGGGCSPGHDQIHGQRDQFCGKVGVAFLTALRETIFDDQVLTLDVAEFSQPAPKALDRPQLQIGHQPDALHPHRLLRARRERPRSCRAAEERDELASSHSITSSARASSVGGTSGPSAWAFFRLITSSYWVGACTGRSAGFLPLRMRSTYPAARRYPST